MKRSYRVILAALLATSIGEPAVAKAGSEVKHKLPETDTTQISSVAQDASGKIWGYSFASSGTLKSWDGHAWRDESFSPAADLQIGLLTRTSDGKVLCVWQSSHRSGNDSFITEHSGASSRVLAKFRFDINYLNSLTLTRYGLLLTANCFDVFRVSQGTLSKIHHVDWPYTPQKRPPGDKDLSQMGVALRVLEDGSGGVWFYSDEYAVGDDIFVTAQRGFLKWDGKNWKAYPAPKGLPDKSYTCVIKRDASSFWVGTKENGLYILDLRTMTATHVTEPEPGAFCRILSVQDVNGQPYVATYSVGETKGRYDTSQRVGTLWRLTSKSFSAEDPAKLKSGGWEMVLRGLDRGTDFRGSIHRAILADAGGLWVAARTGGVWRLRPGANPLLVNWRQGFNLSACNAVIPQADGRLFCAGSVTVDDIRPFAREPIVDWPKIFTVHGYLTQDKQNHLWGMSDFAARQIREWDGVQWRSYALPADYEMRDYFYVCKEAMGRIWVMPQVANGKVIIANPNDGRWLTYPNFKTAMTTELAKWRPATFSKLGIGTGGWLEVEFQAPNRIVYRNADDGVDYFDGKTWQSWNAKTVSAGEMEGDSWRDGPYFNSRGQITANLGGWIYSRNAKGAWKLDEHAKSRRDERELQPPPGSGIENPQSIVKDREGTVWIVKDRQLYKVKFGLCIPQIAPEERNPFYDGRGLLAVYVDARGKKIFASGVEWSNEYFFEPSRPAPDTDLNLQPAGEDDVTVTMSTPGQGKAWFRWRLDGKTWSPPQTGNEVQLRSMPAGRHVFEAAAIDKWLDIDPTPARVSFEINIEANAQIAKYLEMLKSGDDGAREKAVAALACQPERALPRLHAARADADENQRWWIDAAIQAAEKSLHP